MNLELETEQAVALAAHLEVATKTYATFLVQSENPIEAIPEIVRHLNSIEEISKAVIEAYTKEQEEE